MTDMYPHTESLESTESEKHKTQTSMAKQQRVILGTTATGPLII